MSQSAANDDCSDQENRPSSDAETEPEIEEDLLQEELRIDGICGVY